MKVNTRQYKRKKGFTVNVLLAKELAEKGQLKHLAMFIYLKNRYDNGCIYKYTQVKLAAKFGISRSAVRKHVKWFLDNGWCHIHEGNLIFNPFKKFDTSRAKFMRVYQVDNKKVKEIVFDLRLLIFQRIQENFNELKKVRHEHILCENHHSYKKAKAFLKRIDKNVLELPTASCQLQISIRKMSKMFGCSVGSAHNIIVSYKKSQDVLCISPGREIVIRATNHNVIKSALNSVPGSYYYNGMVYANRCNQYIF